MQVFVKEDGKVLCRPLEATEALPDTTLWVDAENATEAEEDMLQAALGIGIPTREEVWKNHALNRMYASEGASYMTAALINKHGGPYPATEAVTFIVTERCLVTLRSIAPTSFKNFGARLMASTRDFNSGPEVMEGLLEEMITRVAYNSEVVTDALDEVSHAIFDPYGVNETNKANTQTMHTLLQQLGTNADLNSKINESLHSFSRLLVFFREEQEDNLYLARKLDVLVRDVKNLQQQTGFVSDKITFLQDATLGMINVEQNIIMKILSVFTVVIMPPTLVAGIYGMNFAHMPELHHAWGYPLALLLMLVLSVGPFMYFRRRGWL